jgi:hypothetical protein
MSWRSPSGVKMEDATEGEFGGRRGGFSQEVAKKAGGRRGARILTGARGDHGGGAEGKFLTEGRQGRKGDGKPEGARTELKPQG